MSAPVESLGAPKQTRGGDSMVTLSDAGLPKLVGKLFERILALLLIALLLIPSRFLPEDDETVDTGAPNDNDNRPGDIVDLIDAKYLRILLVKPQSNS